MLRRPELINSLEDSSLCRSRWKVSSLLSLDRRVALEPRVLFGWRPKVLTLSSTMPQARIAQVMAEITSSGGHD